MVFGAMSLKENIMKELDFDNQIKYDDGTVLIPFKANNMVIKQTIKDIVTDELMEGAILNNEYRGFKEDYSVLHCLLRIHKPKSVFEVGCNCGTGTNIICNALPEAKVYSLDLPTELAHVSLQHPISEGKGDQVGANCKFPFTLLRGDSTQFDYSMFPCEAYFVDGEHDEAHVTIETKEILKQKPKLIAYHDADMPEVWAGIIAGLGKTRGYELYRVEGTRIAYLLKK
jgi:precorrin-6B methylase 2